MLDGLSGRVVEVGAGNGLNFPHYPASVDEVVAVEPEAYLRERAEGAARTAPVPIQVTGGLAGALPLEDTSFDAAVVSGVLCSVPDQEAALADLRRVLRPGGELRFYEHVRARGSFRARSQDAADLVWPRLMGGCHPNRDTLAAIERAGFRVERCRGLQLPALGADLAGRSGAARHRAQLAVLVAAWRPVVDSTHAGVRGAAARNSTRTPRGSA